MAQVLAELEDTRGLPILTATELNEAYARLDERYNGLRSNWEWFAQSEYTALADFEARVEQN